MTMLDINRLPVTDDTLIEDLLLSVRTANCLQNADREAVHKKAGYRLLTVGDVRKRSDMELLWIPNLGRVTLAEIRKFAPYGCDAVASPPPAPSQIEALQKEVAELRERVARLEARVYPTTAVASIDRDWLWISKMGAQGNLGALETLAKIDKQ